MNIIRLAIIIILASIAACDKKVDKEMNFYIGYKYNGSPQGWEKFLTCWENETIKKLGKQEELLSQLQHEVFNKKTQMYQPASTDDIEKAEKRLNLKLPQSFKDFLSVTNGWIQIDMDADDGNVLSTKDIDLVDKLHPDIGEGWNSNLVHNKDYYNYTDKQDVVSMRSQYIKNSLVISDLVDSGIYLLNPNIVDDYGEWEAWFLGWHLPGAVRFNSFAGLMRYAYYKSIYAPDYDGIYPEELLEKTCAKYLPVEEYKKELKD